MIYNPLDLFYKSVKGAVSDNQTVIFRVKGNFDSVIFVYKKDGQDLNYVQMNKDGECFSCSITFPVGLYFYYFALPNGEYISNENLEGIISNTPNYFQLTSFLNDFETPEWIKGGIIYQIFPDRFNSSGEIVNDSNRYIHEDKNDLPRFLPNKNGNVLNNDFFGGNIKGIIQKLPYLNELGVSVIYLNPIFKAYSNHRYDTGNYFELDSMLGTFDDFDLLIKTANKFNIKIILDGVFNHTGDDSLYFNKYGSYNSNGAYNSKDSPYYSWYYFGKNKDDYKSWWGINVLPTINKNSKDYINFICGEKGVLDFYIKKGVYGWRLDVVDELPSGFVKEIRKSIKRANGDAVIIGEVWEDASNKISYGVRREYFQGMELDSVMNYPLKNAIIDYVRNKDCKNLLKIVKEQNDHYPKNVLDSLMNILSTHDTARILSALGDKDYFGKTKEELSALKLENDDLSNAIMRLKIASLIQFTLYGVPCIYYGDEAGMQGYIDPFNRCYFPWDNINNEIKEWYKTLGKVRNTVSAFKSGDFSVLYSKDGLFAFTRKDKNSEVFVLTNVGDFDYILSFKGKIFNLIDDKEYADTLTVNKNFYGIFIKNA